jgi:hypothetical protein
LKRPARPSRDFYGELIAGSQSNPARLLERERWLRGLKVEGKEELLFQLEMLLRGLERYFNLHNLGLSEQEAPVVARDFREELLDVREALEAGAGLARRLTDPDTDQRQVFRRYVESRLADDRVRRALLEEELSADDPEASLYLLRQSFESLRVVVDHLVKSERVVYPLFREVGHLALKEILLNRYFRPFRALEFRLEYDRVKSVPLLEALARCPEADRPPLTVVVLGLSRLLHYLTYVSAAGQAGPSRLTPIVLALVKSELATLVGYIRNEVAPKLSPKRSSAAMLRVSKELNAQAKRLTSGVAQDALEAGGACRAVVELQLVAVGSTLGLKLPEDGFQKLVSPAFMAQRLSRDLWLFSQLCRRVAQALRGGSAAEEAWAGLGRFAVDFQQVGYQLLRYADYEPFDRFIALVLELPRCPDGPEVRARLAEDCERFADVAESTYQSVTRRADLFGKPMDTERLESDLLSYLSEGRHSATKLG